jgi:hypothetical protein
MDAACSRIRPVSEYDLLVNTACSGTKTKHYAGLVFQIVFPTLSDLFLGEIGLGQVHKESVMTGLAYHEGMVKAAKVFVAAMQRQESKSLAGSGFDQSATQ